MLHSEECCRNRQEKKFQWQPAFSSYEGRMMPKAPAMGSPPAILKE